MPVNPNDLIGPYGLARLLHGHIIGHPRLVVEVAESGGQVPELQGQRVPYLQPPEGGKGLVHRTERTALPVILRRQPPAPGEADALGRIPRHGERAHVPDCNDVQAVLDVPLHLDLLA